MSAVEPAVISVRGSEGVFLLSPAEQGGDYAKLANYKGFHDDYKNCRITAFDGTGRFFGYSTSTDIKIIDLKNGCQTVTTVAKPRTCFLSFSPLGNYFVLWETFYVSKDERKDVPNLNIYSTLSGQLVLSMVRKKQENFVQWSNDETVFSLFNASNEICFYESSNPSVVKSRIKMENLSGFNMSAASKCVAVHSAGKKSEPSSIRLYQYPNVSEVIANKSFFNADQVEFKWNKAGNNLLLLCSTETSQNSYYGDTTLHQIKTNGDSQFVQLSKKGAIYAYDWNPVKDEFVVVYGTMPAKATLFNGKCEPVYDFGTGARNECHYNPHGNILCLAGFGNLRGRVEVWNLATPTRVPQQLASIQADDTTLFEWSPDGVHLLTATTAPRLRVSNGFKVWSGVTGELKYTYMLPQGTELWKVHWQPGTYQKATVVVKNIQNAPVVTEEAKAYVPPHLRGAKGGAAVSNFNSKLHHDEEKPDKALKAKVKSEGDADDPEKKIKLLRKKVTQIDDLKKRQAAGEKLEKNQLDKLNTLDELIAELKKLGAN